MFGKIEAVKELTLYLSSSESELGKMASKPRYNVFKRPKPGKNEYRLIEAPAGKLKTVLDRISDGLQWIYSQERTTAAYGYIRHHEGDPDKRDILTNAKRHACNPYLLNIDLDDFFHQITTGKVREIFGNCRWFRFDKECQELLVALVCYNQRLPMGSPTSPPLSNFAMYQPDIDLLRWARGKGSPTQGSWTTFRFRRPGPFQTSICK